jgi:HAE1 family hydrophobic/amphiphilic exporter-1
VQTVPKDQRKRTVFDLINVLRGQARQIPGASFNGGVESPLPGGGGGGAGSINVSISGPDLNTVTQLSNNAQNVLQSVPGVADVRNSNLSSVPELDIQLDRVRMAELGVTNQQVDQALSAAIGGTTVTEFQPPGTQQQDITLLADPTHRYDLTTLQQIPVGVESSTSSAGAPVVTLGQVATLTNGTGPVTIQRVNRQVTASLTATPNGRPLGDVANDVNAAMQTIPFPAGYGFTLRGQVQVFNQAITALGSALLLSAILEYMLLVALYESWLFPLVRMLTVPLGMIGAFVLLWLTGNTINIFSIIGMIMGEGLVAKSGILLVDYANTLRERGVSRIDALTEAVKVRLRPILMTSFTMIFGMLPLALKLEPGAETRAPMAIVVIGALLSSTVLTLVVVPALYTMIDDLQVRLFGVKRRGWAPPVPTATKPAPTTVPTPHTPPTPAVEPAAAAAGAVPLNIMDFGSVYLVRAAVPGIKMSDIDVSVDDRTLTIRGTRHTNGHTGGTWVVQEYAGGDWERSMPLPVEVEGATVTASYEDGILELRLPKTQPDAARRRKVPIAAPPNGEQSSNGH